MSTGCPIFSADDMLRHAFIPFGTVVLAQVLRDESGHSLGLGVVHMASSEDVARVFNEHHRFEVSGSNVDLWEPAEPPQESPGERTMASPRNANSSDEPKHGTREEPGRGSDT